MSQPENHPQLEALRKGAEGGDLKAQAVLAQNLVGIDFKEALDWMQKAADGGLAEGHYFLGVWHTEGIFKKQDLPTGFSHLEAAEKMGLPLARHYRAYFKAKGLGGEKDWAGGVADVKALAENQNPYALSQLGFLLLMTKAPENESLGQTLIQAAAALGNPQAINFFDGQKPGPVKISGRLLELAAKHLQDVPAPPLKEPKIFSQKPEVALVPEIISKALAGYVTSRALPYLRPSRVIDNISGVFVPDPARTSTEHRFLPHKSDLVIHAICERIAPASGLPEEHQEIFGVLRYQPGQEYKPHSDFLQPDLEGNNPEAERAGQRAKTFLIYLNDAFEGGETDFPKLGLRLKPGIGDGLLFSNITDSGKEHPLSLHAGRPVISGEKFITTLWIRDREYSFPVVTPKQ